MAPSRVGEFKLQRQRGGIGFFGQVRVRLVRAAAVDAVSWAVPGDDRASMQPWLDADLVAAAIAGARKGLALVGTLGVDVRHDVVEIVHARMNLTDIEASSVWAAAALAVADAYGLREHLELGFDSGWTVSRLIQPAQGTPHHFGVKGGPVVGQ